MRPIEQAKQAMTDVLADDPFASITTMANEAMDAIHGNELDLPWIESLAFEVSETIETCF